MVPAVRSQTGLGNAEVVPEETVLAKLVETEGPDSAPARPYRECPAGFFAQDFRGHQQNPRDGVCGEFVHQEHEQVGQGHEGESRQKRAGQERAEQSDPGPRVVPVSDVLGLQAPLVGRPVDDRTGTIHQYLQGFITAKWAWH